MALRFILAFALTFGFQSTAQAEEPCDGRAQSGVTSFFGGISALLRLPIGPCQEIMDQMSRVQKQVDTAQNDLDSASLARDFWHQEHTRYMEGQEALIQKNFGDNVYLTSTAISAQLVLDALVVGKAFNGAKSGVRAMSAVGSARQALIQNLQREFRDALASEVLSKGNEVLQNVSDTSWSGWDLVPFVVPFKRLSNIFDTPDQVEILGEAQLEAFANRIGANRRMAAAEQELQALNRQMAQLLLRLGRCQERAGS